jgi:hypothetical protein
VKEKFPTKNKVLHMVCYGKQITDLGELPKEETIGHLFGSFSFLREV